MCILSHIVHARKNANVIKNVSLIDKCLADKEAQRKNANVIKNVWIVGRFTSLSTALAKECKCYKKCVFTTNTLPYVIAAERMQML